MAVITVLASHSIESIADIHRGFNSLFEMDVEYNPAAVELHVTLNY